MSHNLHSAALHSAFEFRVILEHWLRHPAALTVSSCSIIQDCIIQRHSPTHSGIRNTGCIIMWHSGILIRVITEHHSNLTCRFDSGVSSFFLSISSTIHFEYRGGLHRCIALSLSFPYIYTSLGTGTTALPLKPYL